MPGENTTTQHTLVLGGTRSGKSAYAEHLLPAEQPVRYLATARTDPTDAEWSARIDAHRARRPPRWRTLEAEEPAAVLLALDEQPILLDDLATWLTGEMDDAHAWDGGGAELARLAGRTDELVDAVRRCGCRLVLVSAEVGLGVVPATRSGRLFRDELGALNTRLARVCDEVLLLVAGIPLRLR
ncbi:MAG TPA: bifunctional adenosylcobinamide kinase/adenosylcobinamide-phosphate guanylyltransferase [Pseudonocardia sp.]|uniref:bifunctional adenosylcobinamide kinase/adenosylcobinamide-phosphate guanylyltransferase n=1 Tax=Pseudonocardia sp. TaxID=60912 RepID=UPI002F40D50A